MIKLFFLARTVALSWLKRFAIRRRRCDQSASLRARSLTTSKIKMQQVQQIKQMQTNCRSVACETRGESTSARRTLPPAIAQTHHSRYHSFSAGTARDERDLASELGAART